MNLEEALGILKPYKTAAKDVIPTAIQYGFNTEGFIPDKLFEVFIAVLLEDKAGQIIDLVNYEVKSSSSGKFDYQYNWRTGLEKWQEEQRRSHLFIVHTANLDRVTVYTIDAADISKWLILNESRLKLDIEQKSKRCGRKSLSLSTAIELGAKLLLDLNIE